MLSYLSYVLSPFRILLRHAQWTTPFPYTTLFRSAKTSAPAPVRPRDEALTGQDAQNLPGTWRRLDGGFAIKFPQSARSEEHTSELQSPCNLVCRPLLEKKKNGQSNPRPLSNEHSL